LWGIYQTKWVGVCGEKTRESSRVAALSVCNNREAANSDLHEPLASLHDRPYNEFIYVSFCNQELA
jgi:hypothetical protein